MRVAALIAALTLTVAGPAGVVAQVPARDRFWALPDSPVAYCAFDGSPLGTTEKRTPSVVGAAIRALVASIASLEGGTAIADEVLGAMGDAPWRACLLELEGESVEVRGGPRNRETLRLVRPGKLAAVIEVRAAADGGGHDRLRAAIEAGLARDAMEDNSPRDRRELPLPGGLIGVQSSSSAPWRVVAWVSKPDAFVVAFGKGTLEKWLGMAPARRAEWIEQRASVNKKRGRADIVFEAFVDLNSLRRGVPDEFAGGRLDRLVHAWHIANDRTFMVHAGLVVEKDGEADEATVGERLLAVDVSWTSRLDKPGQVQTASISEGKWPAELAGAARKEGWAMLVRTGVPSWIEIALDTYEALGPAEFGAIRNRWERRMAPMLGRIVPRVGEWAVVRPGPELTLSLKPAEGPDRLTADLRALFSTLAPVVVSEGKGWRLEVPQGGGPKGAWRIREDGAAINVGWTQPD